MKDSKLKEIRKEENKKEQNKKEQNKKEEHKEEEERFPLYCAIGNHDEGNGEPVNRIAAALILADKSDVRRSRVQQKNEADFDIHDRVNYSVTESKLKINKEHTGIKLKLHIDTRCGEIGEYFEIFMDRMLLCKKAAGSLGLAFHLIINETPLM